MFSFLTPIWLAAIPLTIGLLLYAYLKHGRSKKKKISSLFFIKQVSPSIASGRQKLSLPWRLLFELLVLLALISALSGAFFKSTSERLVLIVDNSLSMGALLNPAEGKETLLDEAKRSAISNLDLFTNVNQTSIWITSPEPRQITNGFVESNQARDQISNISLSFAAGNISAVLSQIKEAEKTLIFSDQSALPKSSIPTSSPAIQLVPLNLSNPSRLNVAIESMSIERSIDNDNSNLNIKVRSYLQKEALCRVKVSYLADNKWSAFTEKDVNLSGISSKEIILGLPSENSNKIIKAYRANISSCSPEISNSLKFDDSHWLTSELSQSQILLISEFSAKQLGLSNISGMQFDSKTPVDWDNISSENSSKLPSPLIIFHRYLPKTLPKANALFIAPPEGSNLLKIKNISGLSKLVRWQKESPILRYLTLPDVSLKNASLFLELPLWGNALMHSAQGEIAIYGSNSQHRYAALGFEILPFEGKSNPFLSILTLNLIKWLSSSGQELGPSTLSKINLPTPANKAIYVESVVPDAKLALSSSGNTISAESPGLLLTSQDNNVSKLLSLNFFSSPESNTLEPGLISLNSASSKESKKQESGLSLEFYLIILALAILLIDSLIFVYRRKNEI